MQPIKIVYKTMGQQYNNQFTEEELATEIWKDIPGYEGCYQASNLGRIKSLERFIKSNWKNKKRLAKDRILVPCYNKRHNRFLVVLAKAAIQKSKYIHTLVLEAFVCIRPQRFEACHNDGNSLNNRLENLRWDTPKNNQADRIKHGTSNRGENHPDCKVNQATINKIRKLYNAGKYSSNELGKIFKLNGRYVRSIINNTARKSETYKKTLFKRRLVFQDIIEIRDLYKNKIFNQYELAKIYNIAQQSISFIVRNKSWRKN